MTTKNEWTTSTEKCGAVIAWPGNKHSNGGDIWDYEGGTFEKITVARSRVRQEHIQNCPVCMAAQQEGERQRAIIQRVVGYRPSKMRMEDNCYGTIHYEATVVPVCQGDADAGVKYWPTRDEAWEQIGRNCSHNLVWNSHEEQRCTECGMVFSVPDYDNSHFADSNGKYGDRCGEPVK